MGDADSRNELEDFLQQTAAALGAVASIREFGVSRTLCVEVDGRVVEVATNGPMLWLIADLEWPGFPTDGTFLTCAPENSLLRAKMLEGDGSSRATGDPDFDAAFLVHGPSAEELPGLSPRVRRLLLRHRHLRPHLVGRGIFPPLVRFRRRPHVRCEPSLFSGPERPGVVEIGSERFRPGQAARWAVELSALVAALAEATRAG